MCANFLSSLHFIFSRKTDEFPFHSISLSLSQTWSISMFWFTSKSSFLHILLLGGTAQSSASRRHALFHSRRFVKNRFIKTSQNCHFSSSSSSCRPTFWYKKSWLHFAQKLTKYFFRENLFLMSLPKFFHLYGILW